MRAIANLHARVRQQESSILGAAKPASLSLSLCIRVSCACFPPGRRRVCWMDSGGMQDERHPLDRRETPWETEK